MISGSSRILLVDDFEMVRMMLRKALNQIGLSYVTDAKGGQEAIDLLCSARQEGDPFSIVFLDWNMPDVNGMDVLNFCRRRPEFVNLPIVMVTAESEHSQVIKALVEGATDYIVKPCSVKTLNKKIAHINKKLAA